MATYSEYAQRQLDQESGAAIDRRSACWPLFHCSPKMAAKLARCAKIASTQRQKTRQQSETWLADTDAMIATLDLIILQRQEQRFGAQWYRNLNA